MKLLQAVIEQLSRDMEVLFEAAKTAHEAATHEENAPDNKYDTLALEASYLAQGQANRASQIRTSIELYKQLGIHDSHDEAQLGSLVVLEQSEGNTKTVFIGPAEGGLKVVHSGEEITVITVGSPMGRELLGRGVGDMISLNAGGSFTEYEIVELC